MATYKAFSGDYQAEAEDIARRRKYAELMQAQALEPIKQETAGGYVVPISWTQGLAKALQGGMGAYQQGKLKTEAQELSERRNQALVEAMGGMPRGTPAQPEQRIEEGGEQLMMPPQAAQQPTWDQRAQWLAQLGKVGPDAVQMGSSIMGMQQKDEENAENRAARSADRKMQLDAEDRRLRERLLDQTISREERVATALQLQQNEDTRKREMQQAGFDQEDRMRRFMVANRPPRQPVQPQLMQTDNGPMQVDRDGRATPIIGSDGKPVKGKSTERALPTSAASKLMENQQNLRRAQQALTLIEGTNLGTQKGDSSATGWKGYVPDVVLQRMDPSGVDARAAISDLGSLIIHDRSGAAVTAAEFPRLKPFIPTVTDNTETAKKKLQRFVNEYKAVTEEAAEFYRNSGYKVPSETLRNANGAPQGTRNIMDAADAIINGDR